MNIVSVAFWSLVLLTAVVSYRWGSISGLIFFVFALVIGAGLASHWQPT
jgi:hypothetical protein